VVKAKADHERVIAETAVSDAERERQSVESDRANERQAAVRAAEQAATEADEALDRAKAARAALPPAEADHGIPCPHCGAFVAIRRLSLVETVLAKIEPIPQAELKRRRLAIAPATSRGSPASSARGVSRSMRRG
jgi:hypothetical protein